MRTIIENISNVQSRIRAACGRSGRDPNDIKLVVVTKTASLEQITEAYNCGIRDFGENKVQATKLKINSLGGLKDVRWHMVGHLQTNKSKDAVEMFSVIHSVDSHALAQEINKRAASKGNVIPVMIEVNVSGEESKYGIKPSDIWQLAEDLNGFKNIELSGLMTMAPYSDDPELSRPFFRRLNQLGAKNGLKQLSMGMSGDFEVAIEEGATIIRVGTSIFSTGGEVL